MGYAPSIPDPEPNYAYKAKFLKGHDGDSFWLRVDKGQPSRGFIDDPTWYIRLYDIDAWELSGTKHPDDMDRYKGAQAAIFTTKTLDSAKRIIVQTIHPKDRPVELEKFGRILARVWVDGFLLSDLIRMNGHMKRPL